ncbi:hypothetical protein D3C72_576350 [compost metagenome]
MRKLLLGLSAMALGGCIFLTPPTGLRVGDHSQEFAHLQQQAADLSTLEFASYDGPDFFATYPKDWGEGRASTDVTTATTTRFSAGVRTTAGESEGIVITTINSFTGEQPTNEVLAAFVKNNLSQGTQSFEVVAEKADDTLGGEPATRLEVKSKDAQGNANHMLAYSLMHEKRGWVIVISTLEGRWASLLPVFEKMAKEFKWKAATASPAPGSAAPTSPAPTASASIVPSAPVASASPISATP